jgi:small subunit ribosomal protein S15
MARMYSRRKGKSKSKRPMHSSYQAWLNKEPEEIKKLVIDLRDQGYSSSMIGMILRDGYGVPSVRLVTGEKIVKILEENDRAPNLPEDLRNLMVKMIRLRRHLGSRPKDLHNKRALQLTESKIRRLVKYYKRNEILPDGWIYDPEKAEMLISG